MLGLGFGLRVGKFLRVEEREVGLADLQVVAADVDEAAPIRCLDLRHLVGHASSDPFQHRPRVVEELAGLVVVVVGFLQTHLRRGRVRVRVLG